MSNLNKLVGKLLVEEKITGLEAIILLGGQFDPTQCVLCEYEYNPYPEKEETCTDAEKEITNKFDQDIEKELKNRFDEMLKEKFEKFEEEKEKEIIRRRNEELKNPWDQLPQPQPYTPETFNPFATKIYPSYICEACKRGGYCSCVLNNPFSFTTS